MHDQLKDSSTSHLIDNAPCALVLAHPGHELRIHAWLEKLQPEVFVLTDGSGSSGQDRVALSESTIEASGANFNFRSAAWSDHDAYKYILTRDTSAITHYVQQLASELQKHSIEWLICDEVEGFNPVHDLCSVMAANACALVKKRTGKHVKCFDFPLEGPPSAKADSGTNGILQLKLSEVEWARKRSAIAQNSALQDEIKRGFDLYGESAFKVEVLAPLDLEKSLSLLSQQKPFYEIHGEKRVSSGVYPIVLRYKEHFLPLIEDVTAWVQNQ